MAAKKLEKTAVLSEEEFTQILVGVRRTWETIGCDLQTCAQENGDSLTVAIAAEAIFNYIDCYGKVDKALLEKWRQIPYDKRYKQLKAASGRWY